MKKAQALEAFGGRFMNLGISLYHSTCTSVSNGHHSRTFFDPHFLGLRALTNPFFVFVVKASYFSPGALLFFTIHVLAVSAFFVKPEPWMLVLALGLFLIRKFGITGGYHRYFSHRSYKTSRWFQFVLAWLGGMSAQKGALWWAAHHRHHHQHSDQPEDIHSVKQQGFYWAHVGWILAPDYETFDAKRVKDLTKYPELVFLNTYHFIPPLALALGCWWLGGLPAFLWCFCVSTVVLYHTTFFINSLCHMLGKRRYETGESSKNSLILALVTLGEGWHNNHHYYQHCARQGFRWWEIDATYYALKALGWLRIIYDIKEPPKHVVEATVDRMSPSTAIG